MMKRLDELIASGSICCDDKRCAYGQTPMTPKSAPPSPRAKNTALTLTSLVASPVKGIIVGEAEAFMLLEVALLRVERVPPANAAG